MKKMNITFVLLFLFAGCSTNNVPRRQVSHYKTLTAADLVGSNSKKLDKCKKVEMDYSSFRNYSCEKIASDIDYSIRQTGNDKPESSVYLVAGRCPQVGYIAWDCQKIDNVVKMTPREKAKEAKEEKKRLAQEARDEKLRLAQESKEEKIKLASEIKQKKQQEKIEQGCTNGNGDNCWDLYVQNLGNEQVSRKYMIQACSLGNAKACTVRQAAIDLDVSVEKLRQQNQETQNRIQNENADRAQRAVEASRYQPPVPAVLPPVTPPPTELHCTSRNSFGTVITDCN